MRASLFCVLVCLVAPSSAWASGSLVISLQDDRSRAIEGTVTATPDGGRGQSQTCSTRGGRCTINGLAAGRFRVSATLIRGGMVPAASVTILEGRAASVRLTALPPPTTPGMSQNQAGGNAPPPQVGQGGQPGGTHAGQGAGVPVIVRGGAGVLAAGQGQNVPGGARPMPGQGPRPIVVQPGGGGAQVVGTNMTAQNTNQVRNLGSGQRASVLGTTQDQRGRRVEGTVTVTQAGRTIGTVSTTGGSFTCFDLSAGSYTLSFTAIGGQRASSNVNVGAGAASSVRLSIVR
jgi:hypothetical protein